MAKTPGDIVNSVLNATKGMGFDTLIDATKAGISDATRADLQSGASRDLYNALIGQTGRPVVSGIGQFSKISNKIRSGITALKRKGSNPALAPEAKSALDKLAGFAAMTKEATSSAIANLGGLGGGTRFFYSKGEPVRMPDMTGPFGAGARYNMDMAGKSKFLARVSALEESQMGLLKAAGVNLPGIEVGSTTSALGGFIDTLQGAGYSVRVEASPEDVYQFSLKRFDRLDRDASTFRVNLGFGHKVPVLPGLHTADFGGGITGVVRTPGTGFSTAMENTPFFVPRAVGEMAINSNNVPVIKKITSASSFYLKELGSYLTSPDTIASGINASHVAQLAENYHQLLVYSAPGTMQNLAKAAEVVPILPNGIKWTRPIAENFAASRPNFYRGGRLNLQEDSMAPFSRAHDEARMMLGGHALYSTAVKPESLINQSVFSVLHHRNVMPWAEFEDPARQLYQVMNRGSFYNGNQFKAIARGKVSVTVPTFSTQFQNAAENLSILTRGVGTSVRANVAMVQDPFFMVGMDAIADSNFTKGKVNRMAGMKDLGAMRDLIMDPLAGSVWISDDMAVAMTRDVTSQLDMSSKKHQRLVRHINKKGYKGLFTTKGRQLAEAAGVGSHLYVGRYKQTVAGVYSKRDLLNNAAGLKGVVPDVIMPMVDLHKYPAMAREVLLSTVMDRALHKLGSLHHSNTLGDTHFKALTDVATKLGAELHMRPDYATAMEIRQANWRQGPGTAGRLLGGKVSSLNQFRDMWSRGYRPSFQVGDALADAGKLTAADADYVTDTLSRAFGIDRHIGMETILAPSRHAGSSSVQAVKSFLLQMGVSGRSTSYNLMAKATRIPSDAAGNHLGTLQINNQGYKLENAIMRRMVGMGPEGQSVANALSEVYHTTDVQHFAAQTKLFVGLSSGQEATQRSLAKLGKDLGIGKYSLSHFKDTILAGGKLNSLRDMADTTGTYFSSALADKVGKGFVLEVDEPLNWTVAKTKGRKIGQNLAEETIARKQFFFYGSDFYKDQFESGTALTEMAHREEEAIRAFTAERSPSYAADATQAYERYEEATRRALGGKTGLVANKWLEPRLAGSLWSDITEQQMMNADQMKRYGRGSVVISQEMAQEAGLHLKKGESMFALMHRDPIQGAGNISAVKVFVDKKLRGRTSVLDPLIFKRGLGDVDQDVMSLLFASTNSLKKSLSALFNRQWSPETLQMHRTSLPIVDQQIRGAIPGLQGEHIDLTKAFAALDAQDADKSMSAGHRLLTQFEAAVGQDRELLDLHQLRIHSVKQATGVMFNAHELLREFAESPAVLDSFYKQKNQTAAALSKTLGMDLGLVASSVLQTAQELASIKKAKTPKATLLTALEELGMMDSVKRAEFLADDVKVKDWRKRVFGAVTDISEEILGGKGIGLASVEKLRAHASLEEQTAYIKKAQAHYLAAKDAFSGGQIAKLSELLKRGLDPNNPHGQEARQGLELIVDYFQHFATSMGSVMEGKGLVGHVSPLIKLTRAGYGAPHAGSSIPVDARNAQELFEATTFMAQAKNADTVAAQQARIAVAIMANSGSMADVELSESAKVVASAVASRPTSIIDPMHHVAMANKAMGESAVETILQWFHAHKEARVTALLGGAVVGLAGMKNLLFPNIMPNTDMTKPQFRFQNPPMFGYNTGQGVDGIPPQYGSSGMPYYVSPSFGRDAGLDYNYIQMGRGMSDENRLQVPDVMSSSYVPMQPSSVMKGMPEPDLGPMAQPRAVVELPKQMRPYGAFARDEVDMTSVDVTMSGGASVSSMRADAAALSALGNSTVQLSISDERISQSRLELTRSVRNVENSRFYFGSTDVGGANA